MGTLMKTLGVIGLAATAAAQERQVTHAPHGHVLTNVNVWSPDSRWLVYDVRGVDTVFDGDRIERVEVATGRVETLYTARDGAKCGVVTWHPRDERVVFIHGPDRPTADWSYGMTRRRGAVVDVRVPGTARPLDAMNYAPPFAPGALRGGSHVHVFSPDGGAVSNTYEDEVLARLGPLTASSTHDLNQRGIAVSVPVPGGVQVARSHLRNHDGEWFSVLVTRTVNRPRPGSDEISRAYEEGWVGGAAADGRRLLAFLGNVTAADGREHAEVFVAELPADLTVPGEAPLQGTATTRPAPPRGTVQRRLTFTAERAHRGVATTPRHWLRASPDGTQIAFLMKDEAGVVQLWTVSPRGGAPRQLTRNAHDVASAFTWSPDGRVLVHAMDGSVCATDVAAGTTRRLTAAAGGVLPQACVVSPDGRSVAFMRNVGRDGASFSQIFTVPLSSP